jgi:predicted Zn-dependent protease with MMP-like domain
VIEVSSDEFDRLVREAIASLPSELASAMENVSIFVEDESPSRPLFGLYEGVPLTRRGVGYAAAMPDRITVYRRTICDASHNLEELRRQVRRTVLHEIAHHFGISDRRLSELGW